MVRNGLGGNGDRRHVHCSKWIFGISLLLPILMSSAYGNAKRADAPPLAADVRAATHLELIRTESRENYLDVHLAANGEIKDFKVFSFDGPPTIVIDLFGMRDRLKGPHALPVEDRRARRIRYGVHPEKLRVVVDTEKPYLKQYQVVEVDGGLRLRIGNPPPPSPQESAGETSTAEAAGGKKAAPVSPPKLQTRAAPIMSRSPQKMSGSAATRLKSVTSWSWGDYLLLNVMADGAIKDYKSFTLNDPARIVFDFYNVKRPLRGLNRMKIPEKWARSVHYRSYRDKVRLVVDTEDAYLEKFTSAPTETGLLIKMGNFKDPEAVVVADRTDAPGIEAAGTEKKTTAEESSRP
ncbi:MAG: AMIN domain-containing protein, partial [Desulfatiglandaceae bacterium]